MCYRGNGCDYGIMFDLVSEGFGLFSVVRETTDNKGGEGGVE